MGVLRWKCSGNDNYKKKYWKPLIDTLQLFLVSVAAYRVFCYREWEILYISSTVLLFKIIKSDANINVASVAVKCVTNFATGLRKAFQSYTNSLAPIILEKFKEKKPILKDPLIECIDAIYATTVSAMIYFILEY
jgi:hypothetical protein